MFASEFIGDERMKRAIFVALGTGLAIGSAAALDIAGVRQVAAPQGAYEEVTFAARTRDAARSEQRARIDEGYRAERESCESRRGLRRDECLVKAHANRGRAMLEAAAPYQVRD